jgi:hypothetical protein
MDWLNVDKAVLPSLWSSLQAGGYKVYTAESLSCIAKEVCKHSFFDWI